jgi:hypothetical protein
MRQFSDWQFSSRSITERHSRVVVMNCYMKLKANFIDVITSGSQETLTCNSSFLRSCGTRRFNTVLRSCGTRRFITVYARDRHRSLPWTRWIQSIPGNPSAIKSILILPSHFRLDLQSCRLPSDLTDKVLCSFLISPCALHAPSISVSLL